MITVACVWVRANVWYPAVYVSKLEQMVKRHLTIPHEFVCLTDRPHLLKKINAIGIPSPKPYPGWWSKLRLFDARIQDMADRVLYLDLDTLVVDSLDPIAKFPAPFAAIPHVGKFEGLHGRAVVKRYNSSVMSFDRDAMADVWRAWSPPVARRLWGDQDFLGEQRPNGAMMPLEWFPRLSDIGESGKIPKGARVILSKKPKNLEAAGLWPWFAERWR